MFQKSTVPTVFSCEASFKEVFLYDLGQKDPVAESCGVFQMATQSPGIFFWRFD